MTGFHGGTGGSFGQRYGGNPKSTENGGKGRGNPAQARRQAKKRRNLKKRNKKR